MVIAASKPKRPRRVATRSCLGPVADLEAHLPEEWWRKLFNALYVKTDGDVVENTKVSNANCAAATCAWSSQSLRSIATVACRSWT